MQHISFRSRLALLAGFVATAIFVACGGTETVEVTRIVEKPVEKIVQQTVVVEKPVEKVVQQTVVVTATATAAPVVKTAPGPVSGGELKVSLNGDISTLDILRTTGTTAYAISYQVQEFLLGYDSKLIAQPLLVKDWKLSTDAKTWTFNLRDGVKFHNGKALDATDAVKSWKRWAERDNFGAIILGFVDEVVATGPLTFEVRMTEPSALVLEGMARIGGYQPVIVPPEMYNVPAAQGATVMLGTGPYKFKEWTPGSHATIERYTDYKPVDSEMSFMAGKKVAYFDTVKYTIVPDANARIAALKVGQLDILTGEIPSEFVDPLSQDANVAVTIIKNNSSRDGAWLDHVDGPLKDKRVRQAFAMAFPVEDGLRAAVGDQRFWTTCPSMMLCGTKWGGFADYSNDIYNARNKGGLEKAKQTIKDLGLVGTKIVVLSPQDLRRYAAPSEISRQVLTEIGFNVEFKVTDWATQTNWREKPELWDVFHTAGGGAWGSNPLLNSSLTKNGYWNKYQDESGKMTAGMQKLARATSADQQLQIVKEMQQVFWEDIPYLSFGDTFAAVAVRKEIQGTRTDYGMPFNVYNTWRAK